MAKNNKGGARAAVSDVAGTGAQASLWSKFKDNSGPIAIIVTIVIVVVPAIVGGIWYLSKYDSRLENLEKNINGEDGIKGQLKEVQATINGKNGLNDQLRVINSKLDLIDKQITKDLKTKASKILKTQNVEIVRAGLLQDSKFSAPFRSAVATQGPKDSDLFLIYTVESITEKAGIIIRVQLERLDSQGHAVKSFYDRRIQIKLPPVGQPEDYAFKMMGENFESPPVHFKFVVLERYGPENLILATALSSTQTS